MPGCAILTRYRTRSRPKRTRQTSFCHTPTVNSRPPSSCVTTDARREILPRRFMSGYRRVMSRQRSPCAAVLAQLRDSTMILPRLLRRAGRPEPCAREWGSCACWCETRPALLKPAAGQGHSRERKRRTPRLTFWRELKSPRSPRPIKVEADVVAGRERSRAWAGPLSIARLPHGDAVPQRVVHTFAVAARYCGERQFKVLSRPC